MLEIVIEYVSIWAPSLVAILGVVITVLNCIKKTKNKLEELNVNESLQDIKIKLQVISKENEELVKCNKILIDQITKIKNYADNTKEI